MLAMKLADAQIAQFEDQGYLFLPNLFSRVEVDALLAEVPALFAEERPENVREKTGGVVRTNFAAHTHNEAYRRLSRHPRLIEPTMQLLGGPVYVHQFKINGKAAFNGDVWQWHQDYGTWARDDEMPEPRAMNVAVFLSEVSEFNAPLMLIPGSHKEGKLEAGHDEETTSYPLWTIDNETIRVLIDRHGIFAAKGGPGSTLMFHGNIVHGSGSNMSPWDRVIVYLSLCHVDNHIRRFKRPEWIAHRDFTAIECLPDDCLLATDAAE
jgi:ectoine hydroxylase